MYADTALDTVRLRGSTRRGRHAAARRSSLRRVNGMWLAANNRFTFRPVDRRWLAASSRSLLSSPERRWLAAAGALLALALVVPVVVLGIAGGPPQVDPRPAE